MNLKKQKQLIARSLGVSPKRVKLSNAPEHKKEIQELISREGAKDLLSEGMVTKSAPRGNSRTRANHIAAQKKKGRRSGHGSRRGTENARFGDKDKWMIKIRALRALLKKFKDEGRLETSTYRDLYRKSKGNFFRNKRHMLLFIEQNSLLKSKEGGKKE
ncbi:MAG: 50S ribosomal protein L19e [Nanoarchaeota archaeon]|nr:50S ribosomal protein L19e [Nanoarchaeota archaeon]